MKYDPSAYMLGVAMSSGRNQDEEREPALRLRATVIFILIFLGALIVALISR